MADNLEVTGELVFETGRGAELPLVEFLLQPIASDLAKRLHSRKRIDRITAESRRKRRLAAGDGFGRGGTGTFWEEEPTTERQK
jgi:hypothetical protein